MLKRTISAMCAALIVACSSEPVEREQVESGGRSGSDGGSGSGRGGSSGGTGGTSSGGTSSDGGSSGGGPVTCERYVKLLKDCGVITGTRLAGCDDEEPLLPCAAACVMSASCPEIEAMYCYAAFNDYAICLEECQVTLPLLEFACSDGSRISARWRCDGLSDCPDGEDEDCPEGKFLCDDGLEIPAGWLCDGFSDCLDGEDELDCGPPLVCDDGQSLPASRECDGVADCTGGEDELDCAMLACR